MFASADAYDPWFAPVAPSPAAASAMELLADTVANVVRSRIQQPGSAPPGAGLVVPKCQMRLLAIAAQCYWQPL